MTIALYGVGVSRGIAIGRAHVMESDRLVIPEYRITEQNIDQEISRLDEAVQRARHQLRLIKAHIPAALHTDIGTFIDTSLLMLEDVTLIQEPTRQIRELRFNAEWALKLQRDSLVKVFDDMDDPYLSTRREDIDHVINRIQRNLLNQAVPRHELPDSRLHGCIIIAEDLTPADTVLMQHQGIAGFATERGGMTSHTAILSRSMGIPAIIGLHQALPYISDDDMVVLDGKRGIILVDPDERSLDYYRSQQENYSRYYKALVDLSEKPARTLDGIGIELQANIELPSDFDTVRKVGASGVGLYRTEFLYMNRAAPPDEEEHYQTYLEVLKILDGLPLTIRSLDLGADKQVDGGRGDGAVQSNPALGLRAVRLCLKEPELFRPQLRAILRASAHGRVRLMIPMVSGPQEVQQVLELLGSIRRDLDVAGLPYDTGLPVGCMIEVPAAAICADLFAERMDFLSIGTNDLIQYTIAIDRVNDEVNYLYDPLHPAVLRLIGTVLDAGHRANIPTAMCGEMAGDPAYTRLLLGLGLREFSVHPANLLEVKQIITASDAGRLTGQAQGILTTRSRAEIADRIEAMNREQH